MAVSGEKLSQKGKQEVIFLRQLFFVNEIKYEMLRMSRSGVAVDREKKDRLRQKMAVNAKKVDFRGNIW